MKFRTLDSAGQGGYIYLLHPVYTQNDRKEKIYTGKNTYLSGEEKIYTRETPIPNLHNIDFFRYVFFPVYVLEYRFYAYRFFRYGFFLPKY